MVGRESEHEGEDGRLRAAEVVGAGPIGDVAVAVDERTEIADHVLDEVGAAGAGEPQHE